MAKQENKINIELTLKQIGLLFDGLQRLHIPESTEFGIKKLAEIREIELILDSAKAELSNSGAEYNACKNVVLDFYKKITRNEIYPFSPMDGSHLKGIIKFLKARYKHRFNKSPLPEEIGKSLKGFLDALIKLPDQWYIKNFSLKIINSSKAEIITKIAKMNNDKSDSDAERERKNKEYWELRKRAEGLIKRYNNAFKEAEIDDRHGKVDFIFKGEQLDWTEEMDLRLLMLDLLEHKK
jgi:hypothetical protein